MTTPAAEVRTAQVTIPAGTAQDSPYTESVAFPYRELTGVYWRVPPGPSGLMGWRLTMSDGTPVIPTADGWIVADDEAAQWAVTGQPDSGMWEVTGYNTDVYDHTVYITFLLDLPAGPPSVTTLPPNSALSSPGPVSTTGVPVG